jgi:tetratricopeptide (TPR) repeat protein
VWISHLLDTSLFGMAAGPRLAVNAALHAVTASALFGTLRSATGARWPSFLAAALFAWHPLHVESVAWVSARKDVLSALGFVLALSAWVRWTRTRSRLAWALVHVAAVLGLLAKVIVMTLPFGLLLLDFWPLRRLVPAAARAHPATLWPLVREKLGLIGLSLAVFAANAFAQQQCGAVQRLALLPLSLRVANAVRSYGLYLIDAISPARLAPYYPFPPGLLASFGSWQDVIASGCFLLGASVFALREAGKRPWLAMGWLWYLGVLFPMIGIVQIGDQGRADRYTYLPLIGIFVAAAWACAEVVERRPRARPLVAAGCAAVLLAYAGLAWRQIGLWRGTIPLFEHTLVVTRANAPAHLLLGLALGEAGDPEAAAPHFEAAVRLTPWVPLVRRSFLANAARLGRLDAAQALLDELPTAPGEPPPRAPSGPPSAVR